MQMSRYSASYATLPKRPEQQLFVIMVEFEDEVGRFYRGYLCTLESGPAKAKIYTLEQRDVNLLLVVR